MVDGRPDATAFDAVVGHLVRAVRDGGHRPVAYGEMVTVLWARGEVVAALELETLWNGLIEAETFPLLCAYPARITGDASGEAFGGVRDAHSEIVGAVAAATLPELDAHDLVASRSFPCVVDASGAARRFATRTFQRWGRASIAPDVQLVVSELVTNAVVHAKTDTVVTLALAAETVRVSVRDGSPVAPQTFDPASLDAASGRGLVLVQAIADRWGVERVPDGKVVWAELRTDS